MNKKRLIVLLVILMLFFIIPVVFFMTDSKKKNTIELSPNSGGNKTEMKIIDKDLALYNTMVTSSDYDGFKDNLKLFIEKKGGKINDEVKIINARKQLDNTPYPRYINVNIPSLNKNYEIKIDYSKNGLDLDFIIESENYLSPLILYVK